MRIFCMKFGFFLEILVLWSSFLMIPSSCGTYSDTEDEIYERLLQSVETKFPSTYPSPYPTPKRVPTPSPSKPKTNQPTAWEYTQGLSKSFTTTYIDDSGQAGIMFDIVVTNTSNVLQITAMDVHTVLTTQVSFAIYKRSGTFLNVERDPTAWKLVMNDIPVIGKGKGNATELRNIPLIVLQPLSLNALYVTIVTGCELCNDMRFSTGLGTGLVFKSNEDIQMKTGKSVRYLFGRIVENKSFNGTLYYTLAGATASPTVPRPSHFPTNRPSFVVPNQAPSVAPLSSHVPTISFMPSLTGAPTSSAKPTKVSTVKPIATLEPTSTFSPTSWQPPKSWSVQLPDSGYLGGRSLRKGNGIVASKYSNQLWVVADDGVCFIYNQSDGSLINKFIPDSLPGYFTQSQSSISLHENEASGVIYAVYAVIDTTGDGSSGFDEESRIIALNGDGKLRWSKQVQGVTAGTPLISHDGTFVYVTHNNFLQDPLGGETTDRQRGQFSMLNDTDWGSLVLNNKAPDQAPYTPLSLTNVRGEDFLCWAASWYLGYRNKGRILSFYDGNETTLTETDWSAGFAPLISTHGERLWLGGLNATMYAWGNDTVPIYEDFDDREAWKEKVTESLRNWTAPLAVQPETNREFSQLYFPSASTSLVAVDAESGKELWERSDESSVYLSKPRLSPADREVLYAIHHRDGKVLKLNSQTGNKKWEKICLEIIDQFWTECESSVEADFSLSRDGTTLFYGDIFGRIIALEVAEKTDPTEAPTGSPSISLNPSGAPSSVPTSHFPSMTPSNSRAPSLTPSLEPSSKPSLEPTLSFRPTPKDYIPPSSSPSYLPSASPTTSAVDLPVLRTKILLGTTSATVDVDEFVSLTSKYLLEYFKTTLPLEYQIFSVEYMMVTAKVETQPSIRQAIISAELLTLQTQMTGVAHFIGSKVPTNEELNAIVRSAFLSEGSRLTILDYIAVLQTAEDSELSTTQNASVEIIQVIEELSSGDNKNKFNDNRMLIIGGAVGAVCGALIVAVMILYKKQSEEDKHQHHRRVESYSSEAYKQQSQQQPYYHGEAYEIPGEIHHTPTPPKSNRSSSFKKQQNYFSLSRQPTKSIVLSPTNNTDESRSSSNYPIVSNYPEFDGYDDGPIEDNESYTFSLGDSTDAAARSKASSSNAGLSSFNNGGDLFDIYKDNDDEEGTSDDVGGHRSAEDGSFFDDSIYKDSSQK